MKQFKNKTQLCPHCGKKYKGLSIHMAKTHNKKVRYTWFDYALFVLGGVLVGALITGAFLG